ncbi:hypothetical protein, partial [Rhizobium leguminosarum]|uniref:hypothetical protein n=1 Tax=Rhizobium leguminosarum TaxID=384 RepID=UPI001C906D80
KPRRNLPKRPENQAFSVIQGDRHADLDHEINLPSITSTYRWLKGQLWFMVGCGSKRLVKCR